MSLDSSLQSLWYGKSRIAWLLAPLAWLYAFVISIRRWMYRAKLLHSVKVDKPVVVIGNITVGGTGKTPLVIWLAQTLTSGGFKVGVIARGYLGKASTWPQVVTKDSDPDFVGDEAVLIAQQTNAIVVAGPDRVADALRAIELGAQVIISDDGLQHYRLHRDIEIAVLDSMRMFGNRRLLPAGPLRESASRMDQVDIVMINQRNNAASDEATTKQLNYRVLATQLRSLATPSVQPMEFLSGQSAHVITGIGNPQAFIDSLEIRGIKVIPHVFPDHARFSARDIQFDDTLPVLMTAKDAVKCRRLVNGAPNRDRYWVVDAHAVLDDAAAQMVVDTVLHRCTVRN
jgi:tetraacyldisaccharide 4'-kinase